MLRSRLSPSLATPLRLLALLVVARQAHAQALCNSPASPCDPETDYFAGVKLRFEHAKNISTLKYTNTYVDFDAYKANETLAHRLVKCGCPVGSPSPNVQVFFTDPKRAYVRDSSVHGLLDTLGVIDRVKYVDGASFVFNEKIREGVVNGNITDIQTNHTILGQDDQLGIAILGFFDIDNYNQTVAKAPYIAVGEVAEVTPLGRAEWMKIVGLLFDKTEEANERFLEIVEAYAAATARAAAARRRPTVFFNQPSATSATLVEGYNESLGVDNYQWTQPGGLQYMSALLRDAGADYRYSDDNKTISNSLNFSQIETDFGHAQFLINIGGFPLTDNLTTSEFLTNPFISFPGFQENDTFAEDLLPRLDAFKCRNLWSNQKRITDDGLSSDFFESGAFQPDILITDYVKMLHPDLRDIKDEVFYSYKLENDSKVPPGGACPFVILDGDPPSGKIFVERSFAVPGKDRYEIDDVAATEILPGLRTALGVGREEVEVYFSGDTDGDDIVLTVRASVDADNEDDIDESDIEGVLKGALGDGVREVRRDDGLSGGAIAGIVIGALVGVAIVIGFVVFILSRRRRQPEAAGMEGFA